MNQKVVEAHDKVPIKPSGKLKMLKKKVTLSKNVEKAKKGFIAVSNDKKKQPQRDLDIIKPTIGIIKGIKSKVEDTL